MTQPCKRPFEEELLSGYLDGALPQTHSQRVRLHLEKCPSCQTIVSELSAIRSAAGSTDFPFPPDTQWGELPQTKPSRWSRSAGWLMLSAWIVVVSSLAIWTVLTQTGDPLEIFLLLGLPGALILLLGSVSLDRLRDAKTDRYRGIHR